MTLLERLTAEREARTATISRCPVHAAVLPCDGEHESRRAAMIVGMHASGDHSYCATMAGCDRPLSNLERAISTHRLAAKDYTRA